jgi:ABC-type branched-subunit amino acid transport system substrate-binding protein
MGRMGGARLAALLLVVALAAACAGTDTVEFETRALRGAALGAPTTTAPADGSAPLAGVIGEQPGAPGTVSGSGGGSDVASDPSAPGGGGTAASAPAVIRIGTVLPLQGGQRDFGEPVLRTTQAFVDELNAAGGVNGSRLELVAYNACLLCQTESLAAVRRLVEQDGVFALVNTYVMAVAFQPVIPYLADRGVPLLQGGAESQTSDALSPVNFATLPPGAFYGRFIPAMVTRYARINRVGIVYVNVPSEANGVPELREELERDGVEVVAVEPVEAAEDAVTNMDSIVTRMRVAGAQGVVATNPVLVIYGRLASARQRWNDGQWIGPAAWSALVEDSCAATCDDLVLTDTAGLSFTDRPSPQMRQFLDVMARRYPAGRTTGHELAAWVGMQLFVETLRKSGADRQAFIRTLDTTANLDLGTTSPLTFSPDRHLGGTQSTLLRLKGGRYVRVSDPVSFGELRS